MQGITLSFNGPQDGDVDHFVVAARSVYENFYRQRVVVSEGDGNAISAKTLGLNPGDSFYVSVATVDSVGHESLFAWPEVRCDSSSCVIPSYAKATPTIPRSSPEYNVEDEQ